MTTGQSVEVGLEEPIVVTLANDDVTAARRYGEFPARGLGLVGLPLASVVLQEDHRNPGSVGSLDLVLNSRKDGPDSRDYAFGHRTVDEGALHVDHDKGICSLGAPHAASMAQPICRRVPSRRRAALYRSAWFRQALRVVDVPSVPKPDDDHQQRAILDRVDDPVVTDPDAETRPTLKGTGAGRSRLSGE